jgi:hypothetical protein
MASNRTVLLALGAGLVGGWVLRSLADSPEGVGVKLMEIGLTAKDRVARWAALERDRLDDMLAEARANIEATPAHTNGVDQGGLGARGSNGEA